MIFGKIIYSLKENFVIVLVRINRSSKSRLSNLLLFARAGFELREKCAHTM